MNEPSAPRLPDSTPAGPSAAAEAEVEAPGEAPEPPPAAAGSEGKDGAVATAVGAAEAANFAGETEGGACMPVCEK